MAFWSRNTREAENTELADYAAWVKEIREPDVDNNGIRRLEAEIRAKRNLVLTGLQQRFVRPRTNKITDLRRELDTLAGMVFAWLYVSGKWDIVQPITIITDDVNDAAMMWLSVDLKKMYDQAYPQKAPRDV